MSLVTSCQTIEDMENCEKHGPYKKFYKRFDGKLKEYGFCPICRDEKIKEAEAKRKKENFESDLKLRLFESNIPKRYQGINIDTINLNYHKNKADNSRLSNTVQIIKKYLDTYPERLKNGASGFLCGECGTGKTMLACIMVENIMNQGYSAHYITAWQMIQEIRQGYKKDISESVPYFIKQYVDKSFLVIDEIGVQHGTDDERILLYQVIDGRYNEVKPTVLISNSMNPVDDGYLDLRTIDRLKDGGGFSITFTGESYRR